MVFLCVYYLPLNCLIFVYSKKKKRYTNKSWYCTRWKTIFHLLKEIHQTLSIAKYVTLNIFTQYRIWVCYIWWWFVLYSPCVSMYFFFCWRYYHKIQFTPQFFFFAFFTFRNVFSFRIWSSLGTLVTLFYVCVCFFLIWNNKK